MTSIKKSASPDHSPLCQGIPVKIDAQHAIAHNKVMIVDGETVITGSFNFTKAAEESNAENLLMTMIRNWLSDIQRTGRNMRSIRTFMREVGGSGG